MAHPLADQTPRKGDAIMREVTDEDRRKEVRALLDAMQQHPERDWSEARRRVAVLQHVLDRGAHAPAG